MRRSPYRSVASCARLLRRTRTAARGASDGQLAVVPRTRRLRRRRRPAAPRSRGTARQARTSCGAPPIPGLAHSSPDRVGRHGLRHERDQQPQGRDLQAGALRRRRRIRGSLRSQAGCSTPSTSARVESRWERVAREGAPRNKRHIKSTYASATPATDGRIVVAWFGSQGIHAYDVNGAPLWKVDLGRVDMGAYDIPTYEWGPASSPIIWNGLVILQCDTQADSFVLALNAETGETVWKTSRASCHRGAHRRWSRRRRARSW